MHETDKLSGNCIYYPDRTSGGQLMLDKFEKEMSGADLILAIPRGGVVTGKVLKIGRAHV